MSFGDLSGLPDSLSVPPAADEFEVSVFGRGVGECIVVHLGLGRWVVVDSFVDGASKIPIARQYLDCLNVRLDTDVDLVVASHWHDDHICGIRGLRREARAARFFCSAALHSQEFIALACAARRRTDTPTGADEWNLIVGDLAEAARGDGLREGAAGPEWALASRRLLERTLPGDVRAEVWSLSPSSASISLALRHIAESMPVTKQEKGRLIAQTTNDLSVALWVSVGGASAILGADLEETGDMRTGWTAVVNAGRPSGEPAVIIKVPHHGALTGDNADLWRQMLTDSPVAALTPKNGSGTPLPTEQDVARLRSRTARLYCAGRRVGPQPPRRKAAVDRTAREVVRKRRVIDQRVGIVRVRLRPGETADKARVDLFGAAVLLER